MKRKFTNSASGIQVNAEQGLPTYHGRLVSEQREKARAAKEAAKKEKQEEQKLFKTSLSALIKRSLKAGSTTDMAKMSLPVPPEYVEALKIHCAHHAKSYAEETINEEFYQVLEKEISRGHSLLSCLYLTDTFVHHSDSFRTVVASHVPELIKACEKGGLFGAQDSRQIQLCQDFLMEIVDIWSFAFGQDHKSFVTLRRYLREAVKLNAPTIEQRIADAERKRSQMEKKLWDTMVDVTERIIYSSWPDATREVGIHIGHLEESFAALLSNTRGKVASSLENLPTSSVSSSSSRQTEIPSSETIAGDKISSSSDRADTVPSENDIDWDNIAWETDSIIDSHSIADDYNNDLDDDFFGTDLLHSSAAMTGDITVVIDPTRMQTFRGVVNEEAKETFEQTQLDTRRAVATTAKSLLSIYKLLQKWERHLTLFLGQLVKREDELTESEKFWRTHKRRRLLAEDSTSSSIHVPVAQNPTDDDPQELTADDEALEENNKRRANARYQALFGRDQAVIERLATVAAAVVEEDLPQTMRRIRTILENQVRALLSR